MCGRYSLEVSYDLFASRYGINYPSLEFQSSAEIFPTQKSPIIINQSEWLMAQWGFSNAYSSQKIINSRLETIDQKKMFKESFESSRCLIPATSFFEWETVDNKKVKHKIVVADRLLFSMAGILKKENDQWVFSILTMASNESFKKIHLRMPVILDGADELVYLNKNTSTQDVLALCHLKNPKLIVQ